MEYIHQLPEKFKHLFNKRLVGFYFIENFNGGGATDWMIDSRTNIYCYVVINPAVLQKSLSDWVTYRDAGSFSKNKNITLNININDKYTGLMYILLHEGTHVFDYVHNITPYLDNEYRKVFKPAGFTNYQFVENTWLTNNILTSKEQRAIGKRYNSYGIFPSRNNFSSDKMQTIYSTLEGSSLISLYSYTKWYEDFADFVTFYHLTAVMQSTYEIKIKKENKIIYFYAPFSGLSGSRRTAYIKKLLYE